MRKGYENIIGCPNEYSNDINITLMDDICYNTKSDCVYCWGCFINEVDMDDLEWVDE